MAAEYSANELQLVPANGPVIFTASPVPCNRGMIYHRDESGLFRLASPRVMGVPCRPCCCVRSYPEAVYTVAFHANIAVPSEPTAGTFEEIQLAIFVDGEEDPSSIMSFTPAAAARDTSSPAGTLPPASSSAYSPATWQGVPENRTGISRA